MKESDKKGSKKISKQEGKKAKRNKPGRIKKEEKEQ